MRSRPLDALVAAGTIEMRRVSGTRIIRLLDAAEEDLRAAETLAGGEHRRRALTIAYECGLKACIALLAGAGYRLRSVPGHHRAALEGALTLLGSEFDATMSRLDSARQLRNEDLYGLAPDPTPEQVARVFEDGRKVLKAARSRLGR